MATTPQVAAIPGMTPLGIKPSYDKTHIRLEEHERLHKEASARDNQRKKFNSEAVNSEIVKYITNESIREEKDMDQNPIEKADWIIIRLMLSLEKYLPEDECFLHKEFRRSFDYLIDKYDRSQLSKAFNSIREEE